MVPGGEPIAGVGRRAGGGGPGPNRVEEESFLAVIVAVGVAGVAALVVAFSLLEGVAARCRGEFLIWAPPALAVAGAAARCCSAQPPEIAELSVVGGAVC